MAPKAVPALPHEYGELLPDLVEPVMEQQVGPVLIKEAIAYLEPITGAGGPVLQVLGLLFIVSKATRLFKLRQRRRPSRKV